MHLKESVKNWKLLHRENVRAFYYAVVVGIPLYILGEILKLCLGERMFNSILQAAFVKVWFLWICLVVVIFALWKSKGKESESLKLLRKDKGKTEGIKTDKTEIANNLKMRISYTSHIDFLSEEFNISYSILNFSTFDLILEKFIEDKVELQNGSTYIGLNKVSFVKEKDILRQGETVLTVSRKLDTRQIKKISVSVDNSCKESTALLLVVYGMVYVRYKDSMEKIEIPLSDTHRVPHYDLWTYGSLSKK